MAVQGAWPWLCLLLLLGLDASAAQTQTLPPEVDLCSQRPGFHPNGEHLEYAGLSTQVYVRSGSSLRSRCLMRFSTCSSCRLSLRPNSTFQFPYCPHHQLLQHDPGYCAPGCIYLMIYDQDYRNQTEKYFDKSSSWGPTDFFSESRTIYAIFCNNQSSVQDIDVRMELSSIEKTSIIRGSSYDPDHQNQVASPMFPANYAENDETYTYKFEATNPSEVIQLIFDDWDLSRKSEIWFDNSNMDGRVMYNNSRPYVVSRGNTLHMTFKTGTQSTPGYLHNAQGFRATYKFLSSPSQALEANTACGLRIEDSTGGIIKFDQLKDPHDYYDCVWVIEPFPDYNGTYVKIITYQGTSATSSGNSVGLWEGQTSVGNHLVTVYPSTLDTANINGYNSPSGFYIRLRGRYSDPNDLVLAYASFALGETKPGMFRCDNMKNIPFKLRCDRYDHCGDGSDERSSLCESGYDWQQHYSYTISTGVIIPMVISIFLIIVICLLIIFIRRCRRLAQQNAAQHRTQIPTVSDATSRRQRRRNRDRSSSQHSNEAPPSYDDVIRTTPVGYLNLAFAWNQGDTTMAQPPSYEEATSPTGLGPGGGERLGNNLNVSSSSSSSGQPGYPSHPGMQYSSSSLESSRPRTASDATSPSESSLDSLLPQQHPHQGRHGGNSEGTRPLEMPRPSRPPGKVEDEFISPVSTSTLRNKGDKQDEMKAPGEQNPSPTEVPSPGAGCQDVSGRVPAAVPEPPAVAEAVITIHEEPRAELEAQAVRYSVPPNQHRRAASHGLESGPQVTLPQPPQQTQSLGRSSNFPPHQRDENRRNPRDDRREDGNRPPPYQQDPRGRNGGGDRPREPGPPRPRPPSREPPRERERREGERRGDRREPDRREGDRKEGGRREPDRRDGGRREGDRRDPDRRGDRREPDRREGDWREPDRKEGDRRDGGSREGDRRDPDRRGDRREPDRREGDRREPDRREGDRREPDRREGPRNNRPPPPGQGSLERSQQGPQNREGRSRPPPRPQSEPRHNRRPPPRENSNPRSPSRGDLPRQPPSHQQRGQGRRGSDEREHREERGQGGRSRGDDRNPRPRNDQLRGGGSRPAPAEDRNRDQGRGRDQDRGQRPSVRAPPPQDVRVNMDEAQSSHSDPDSGLVVSNSGMTLSLCRGDGPENDDIFV